MRRNLIPVICNALGVKEGEKFELFGNAQGFDDTPLLCKLTNDCILVWNTDTEKWEEIRGTFVDALTGKDAITKICKKENEMENMSKRKNSDKLVVLTDVLTTKFTQMLENYAREDSNFLLTTMLTMIAKYNSKTPNFRDIYNDIKAKRDDINVVRFGYSLISFNPYKKSTPELFLRINDAEDNTVSINLEADLDPSTYELDDVQLCVIASLASAVVNTLTKCRELDAKLKRERMQEHDKQKEYGEKTFVEVLRELFDVKTIASISVKLNNGNEVTINLSDKQEGHNTEE